MEKTKVIGKNIGVIVLSIIVLIIGGIAENIAKQCLSGQYLQLIIPALVRIAVTIVLAWFVSGTGTKVKEDRYKIGPYLSCLANPSPSFLCLYTSR